MAREPAPCAARRSTVADRCGTFHDTPLSGVRRRRRKRSSRSLTGGLAPWKGRRPSREGRSRPSHRVHAYARATRRAGVRPLHECVARRPPPPPQRLMVRPPRPWRRALGRHLDESGLGGVLAFVSIVSASDLCSPGSSDSCTRRSRRRGPAASCESRASRARRRSLGPSTLHRSGGPLHFPLILREDVPEHSACFLRIRREGQNRKEDDGRASGAAVERCDLWHLSFGRIRHRVLGRRRHRALGRRRWRSRERAARCPGDGRHDSPGWCVE